MCPKMSTKERSAEQQICRGAQGVCKGVRDVVTRKEMVSAALRDCLSYDKSAIYCEASYGARPTNVYDRRKELWFCDKAIRRQIFA